MSPIDFATDVKDINENKTSSRLYADLQHDHGDHKKLQDDVKQANAEFEKQGILNHLELSEDSITGSETVKNSSDNTKAVFTKNGAIVQYSDKEHTDHITTITRADGSTSQFAYEKDTITSCTNTDKNGNRTTQNTKDGSQITADAATGDVTTERPDGTTEVQHGDGSVSRTDRSGNLISSSETQAQGKINEANAVGQLLANCAIDLPKDQRQAYLSKLLDLYGQLGSLAATGNDAVATAAMFAQATVGSSINTLESLGRQDPRSAADQKAA